MSILISFDKVRKSKMWSNCDFRFEYAQVGQIGYARFYPLVLFQFILRNWDLFSVLISSLSRCRPKQFLRNLIFYHSGRLNYYRTSFKALLRPTFLSFFLRNQFFEIKVKENELLGRYKQKFQIAMLVKIFGKLEFLRKNNVGYGCWTWGRLAKFLANGEIHGYFLDTLLLIA